MNRLRNILIGFLAAWALVAMSADVVLLRLGVDTVAYQTSGTTVVMTTTTTTTTTTQPTMPHSFTVTGVSSIPGMNGDYVYGGTAPSDAGWIYTNTANSDYTLTPQLGASAISWQLNDGAFSYVAGNDYPHPHVGTWTVYAGSGVPTVVCNFDLTAVGPNAVTGTFYRVLASDNQNRGWTNSAGDKLYCTAKIGSGYTSIFDAQDPFTDYFHDGLTTELRSVWTGAFVSIGGVTATVTLAESP